MPPLTEHQHVQEERRSHHRLSTGSCCLSVAEPGWRSRPTPGGSETLASETRPTQGHGPPVRKCVKVLLWQDENGGINFQPQHLNFSFTCISNLVEKPSVCVLMQIGVIQKQGITSTVLTMSEAPYTLNCLECYVHRVSAHF